MKIRKCLRSLFLTVSLLYCLSFTALPASATTVTALPGAVISSHVSSNFTEGHASLCDGDGTGLLCWYTASDAVGHGLFGSDKRVYTPVPFDYISGSTTGTCSTVQAVAKGDSTNCPFTVISLDSTYHGETPILIVEHGGSGTCVAESGGNIVFHACPSLGGTADVWIENGFALISVVRSDFCENNNCFVQSADCNGNGMQAPQGIVDSGVSADQLCTSANGYQFESGS